MGQFPWVLKCNNINEISLLMSEKDHIIAALSMIFDEVICMQGFTGIMNIMYTNLSLVNLYM